MKPSRKISLKRILQQHERHSIQVQVPDSIGDAFLCNNSPIFLKIRECSIQFGYKYSSENCDLYFDFPLLALNDIYKNKIIPVRKNVAWLNRIEKTRPGFYRLEDLYEFGISKNYLLHEAAHATAFELMFKSWKKFKVENGSELFIPKLMLGESFANAVELFFQIEKPSDIEKYFRWCNTYSFPSNENRKLLQRTSKTIGSQKTFLAVVLLYLYSNYLYKDLENSDLESVLSLVDCESKGKKKREILKLLKRIAKTICFQLSIGFRAQSSKIYLSSLGYSNNILSLLHKDPIQLLVRNHEFYKVFLKFKKLVPEFLDGGKS